MNFKHILLASATAAVMFACGEKKTETKAVDSTGTEVTYTVDAAASKVEWKGVMAGVKAHYGTVNVKDGSVTVKGSQITAGTFNVDLASIAPLDSTYDEKNTKEGLITHLKDTAFFNVKEFPTATFVIKKVSGNSATGDLTVRGKTNEETVTDIVVTADSANVNATGKLVFDRQKYGVAFSTGSKDYVINDNIELNITLVGKK